MTWSVWVIDSVMSVLDWGTTSMFVRRQSWRLPKRYHLEADRDNAYLSKESMPRHAQASPTAVTGVLVGRDMATA